MPQCQLPVFFCFWFQESQKMNILGIGRDKSQSSYFTGRLTEPEYETEEGQGLATPPRRGLALPTPPGGVGPLALHRPCPLAYKKPLDTKTLNSQSEIHEKFRSAAATEGEIRGTESLCSGTLPGRGSAPGAISIDLHHHLHHHC